MSHVSYFSALNFFAGALTLAAMDSDIHVQNLSLTSGKDKIKGVYCLPPGKGPFPGLIILHGDFGLTPWVEKQARRLAEKGYAALAVDLYRGELPKDVEEAHILERGLPEEQVLRDVKAAVAYLGGQPEIRKDRLGAIGWEMGAGHALETSTHEPRLRAVVVCYGRLITDPAKLAQLGGAVLGIFAANDEGIHAETRKRFQAAMARANKRLAGLHVFAADIGFMDPDSPYREGPVSAATAADAWRRIDTFLAKELKQ